MIRFYVRLVRVRVRVRVGLNDFRCTLRFRWWMGTLSKYSDRAPQAPKCGERV